MNHLQKLCLWAAAVLLVAIPPLGAQQPPGGDLPERRVPDSWLYVDEFTIRHEVLMPLVTLESFLPVTRAQDDTLTVEEQQAAGQLLEQFFALQNPVEIDGLSVQPVSVSVSFTGRDIAAVLAGAEPEDRNPAETFVGVISEYETKGPAKSVSMTWTLFEGTIESVQATVYAGDHEQRRTLTAAQPRMQWRGEGVSAGPPVTSVPVEESGGFWPFRRGIEVEPQQAREVMSVLLRNIYRAFDYRRDEAVYDALAESVAGDLLTDLYLKIQRSLTVQTEGGPATSIERVELTGGEKLGETSGEEAGFRYNAVWEVRGRVEHWGHIHTRLNQYEAEFAIEAREGAWKITGLTVKDQKRLETYTRARSESDTP